MGLWLICLLLVAQVILSFIIDPITQEACIKFYIISVIIDVGVVIAFHYNTPKFYRTSKKYIEKARTEFQVLWYLFTLRKLCFECWGTGIKTKHGYEHNCPLCDGRKWVYPNWRYGSMVTNLRCYVNKLSGGDNGST